LAAAKLIDP